MTTQTSPQPVRHPKPYGPFGLAGEPLAPAPQRETRSLEPEDAAAVLDALPLLDHAIRRRTRSTMLVARGHYLAMQDGDETRLLRLEASITHLGRGSDAAIRFDEHRVSRSHAVLVRHGRHFRILDNRSSNGTFVNGRRITATNLESGDEILLGPVAMQYLVVE
jgi:pSer/pThr/pTyr-binding forkhead associated (FHA) protein